MSKEIELGDANDALLELANRREHSPERQLLAAVLYQAWVDLTHPSFQMAALIFFQGESAKTICGLLGLDVEVIRQQVSSKAVNSNTKKQPIVWTPTFNSREMGVSDDGNNDRNY